MSHKDSFEGLARFYDPIMQHVNYDRWYLVAGAVARLLPAPFRHLDAACGTGAFLKRLWNDRWNSYGLDLSASMIRAGKRSNGRTRAVCADLRAVPMLASFDYVTCLFDSINFLLTEDDLRRGIAQLAGALRPQGILYIDVVTERMVLEHFAGQEWTETNNSFSTTWSCNYDRATCTAETRIRINTGEQHTLHERMYPLDTVLHAVEDAGCELLAVCDAQNWKRPGRRTIRADIIAVKGSAHAYKRAFRPIQAHVRDLMR